MSTKVGPAKAASLRKVITALQDLIRTLPTPEELHKMDESLEALITYLRHIQQDLKSIPMRDEFGEASVIIDQLDTLLRRAEENPIIGRAIGLEKPLPKKLRQPTTGITTQNAREALHEFEDMTIDQIRDALSLESKYSLADLRQIADALGIRVQSTASRDVFASRITTRLANSRGYRNLSKSASGEGQ
jgi:hypothetical protein